MPGPAPGQTCSVCNDPRLGQVHAAKARGESSRKIAKMFPPLQKDAVNRHFFNRHPGTESVLAPDPVQNVSGAAEQGEGSPAQGRAAGFNVTEEMSPRQKLEELIRTLEQQVAEARKAQRPVRTDLARELRMQYEALDRMGGGEPPTEVRPEDVVGLSELLGALGAALKPHPEARAAALAVLRERGLVQ